MMFYGDYLRYENDIFIGHQIMLSLEENKIDYRKKPIIFVGRRKSDSSKIISNINCGGMSFFEDPFRDKNQMYRITFFLKSLGYDVLNASYEEMEIGRNNADKMNNWPLDGSVKEIDSLILVKLSED
jgi:hypothetical protein